MTKDLPSPSLSMGVDFDRISNLPNEVIDKILSNLPIKDGARTSVLASNWRYKWAKIPHLKFHASYNSNIVNHVLLGHFGPIRKFQLYQGSKDIRDIDRWILYLSRHHPVHDLKFQFSWKRKLQRHKMPSCMFSCQDMIYLNLSDCILKPPSTFKGFRSLKSLYFKRVTLTQDVFEHMNGCCPLLERFTTWNCDGFSQLKIDAPNLLFLQFYGDFHDFIIVNTLKLADVFIDLLPQPPVCHSSGNLLKLFVDLPNVQSLKISGCFMNYLAGGALLEQLPKPCLHLKYLEIDMSFDEVEHVLTAVCLLRSSPALETLTIYAQECKVKAPDVGAAKSWLGQNRSCTFSQLRHVTIRPMFSVEAQLDFIRILLISSPSLETLTVGPPELDTPDGNPDLVVLQKSSDVVRKLLRFRRASLNLEIIYSEF